MQNATISIVARLTASSGKARRRLGMARSAPRSGLSTRRQHVTSSFGESLDRDRSAGEMITAAQDLFATLRKQQLEPILILDDRTRA